MAASPIPLRRQSVVRSPPAALPEPVATPAAGEWPEADLSGVVLENRYRLLRPLGVGGMGTVYLAQHVLLGTHYAIKVLGPRYAFDREWVQRFFLEARAALMIPHENIVRIHDFAYPEPGRVYMVMELVDGESLADLVEREGSIPWQRALQYADQIAAALEAAHARGIVHRDIKPSNCLRCAETDLVKVLDFGIAKFLDPGRAGLAVPRTSTDVWMGTAEFMAPELFRGDRADERVDIYALGALLFKLLTGRTPYIGTHIEVATQMLTELPPMPSAVAPAGRVIPPAVDRLIAGTLAHAPAERTPTMAILRQQIAAVLADEEALEPTVLCQLSPTLLAPVAVPSRAGAPTAANVIHPPASVPAPGNALRRGHRGVRGGLAALGALLVLGGGVAWSMPSSGAVERVPPIVSPAPAMAPRIWEPPVIPEREAAPSVGAPSVGAPSVGAPSVGAPVSAAIEVDASGPERAARASVRRREQPVEPVVVVAATAGDASHRPPPPPPPVRRMSALTVPAMQRELDGLRSALATRCFVTHSAPRGTRLIGEVVVDSAGRAHVEFPPAALPVLAACIRYWVRDHRFPTSEQGGSLKYSFFAQRE